MVDHVEKIIEEWFANQSDDEFVTHDRDVPYAVVGPSVNTKWIIFCTKPTIISEAMRWQSTVFVGMIGRYGLPNDSDISWMRNLIGDRTSLFLGDMDPVDLMVFAWLRCHLSAYQISHLGINDSFCAEQQIDDLETLSMSCSPSEHRSLVLLTNVFPDFEEIVGPRCSRLLKEGRKIEIEAIISYKETAAHILDPLLT